MDQNSDVSAALEFAKKHLPAETKSAGLIDGEEFGFVVLNTSGGQVAKPLEDFLAPFRPNPRRRKGKSSHVTLDSLILHTNRFKDGDSVLFANGDTSAPGLLAVFDYNEKLNDYREATEGAIGTVEHYWEEALPRHGQHQAQYLFPLSPEWTAWNAANGVEMSQAEFAAFLEDRILDVLPPPADGDEAAAGIREIEKTLGGTIATQARLMELSRGLAVHVDERVASAVNLQTGEGEVSWEAAHTDAAGAPLKIPSLFLIGIPVFKLGASYRIVARLRYRKQGGSLKWFYNLHRIEHAFDDAYNEACKKAAVETDLPLFYGSPES